MKTICLQVQDDFIESFLKMLPEDKIKIVDPGFASNQNKLQQAFENYLNSGQTYMPYYEQMKELDEWLRMEINK